MMSFSKHLKLLFVVGLSTVAHCLHALEVGVNTHLGQGHITWSAVSTAIKDLGITADRDEIYWGAVEAADTSIAMARAQQEMLSALAASSDVFQPMLVAGYGNINYDQGVQPTSAAGRQAYARYAAALVSSYGNRMPYIELWNEWNLGAGNNGLGVGTADNYAALVKAASAEIRKLNSATKIIIGAAGDDLNDWAWTKGVINAGVISLADGYSVHMYNYSAGYNATPEEMFTRLERLQVILRGANAGKDYPVYVTELGWPTHTGSGGTTPQLSGAYLARFILEASGYSWIKGAWIYELFDGGADQADREQNFGLYNFNHEAKPGTCNVKAAVSILKSYSLVGKGTNADGIRWLQFENQNSLNSMFVVFSSLKNGSATINVTEKPSSLCSINLPPPSPPVAMSAAPTAVAAVPVNPAVPAVAAVSVTEVPVFALLKGVGHKSTDFFTK